MNISDIMIRILAIEEYYGKNNIGFKMYNKMQEIRVKGNKLIPQHQMFYEKEFKTLIKSFEENGFINTNPIYLNEDFEALPKGIKEELKIMWTTILKKNKIKRPCFD